MAYGNTDMDALRIFADPALSPGEKQRLLEELMAPGMPAAPPQLGADTRLAMSGGGTTGMSPGDGAPQTATSGTAPLVPAGTDGPAPAPGPSVPPAPPPEEEEELAAVAPGVSPGDYRNSASRAALLLAAPAGGKPAVPQEQIQERTDVTRGPIDAAGLDEYRRLQQDAADSTVEAERWRMMQEQGAREAQVAALEREQSERARINQIRQQALREVSRIREQQEQISNEISNAEPAEEGLFVGKNFGESVLTVIGVLAMGLGMGATGNADQIAPTIQAMARREVDRQKRWLGLKGEQANALGSAYERHMANLRDHELASTATVADILKMGELQALRLARDTGVPRMQAELQAKASALGAAAMAEYGKLAAAYGHKVQTATQLTYQQDRGTRAAQDEAQAQAQTAAAAAAQAEPETEEAHFQRLLGQQAPELDADVREATGQPEPQHPAPGSAQKGGAAPKQTKGAPGGDRASEIMALHAQGRTDEAVARLAPQERAYLAKLYKQAKADLGAGATDAEAVDLAMQRFGAQSPVALVPQSARDRVVRADGKTLFANDKAAAALAQKQITDGDKAIGLASQMARLAEQYRGSGYKSPELRGRLLAIGSDLMAILSKVDEQGVIREGGDEARYSSRAGLAVRDYLQDPTTDHAAAVKETLRTLQAGRRRVISTLSTSWTGDEPARREIREVAP